MKEKIIYNWEQFSKDILSLSKFYNDYGKILKNIYGVPRGGLVPAVALSNITNIPLLFDKERISRGTLIIDDIYDTGKTLKKLLKNKEYLTVIVLWLNGETNQARIKEILPTYCRIKKDNQWVVFPWEL